MRQHVAAQPGVPPDLIIGALCIVTALCLGHGGAELARRQRGAVGEKLELRRHHRPQRQLQPQLGVRPTREERYRYGIAGSSIRTGAGWWWRSASRAEVSVGGAGSIASVGGVRLGGRL